MDVDGLDTFSAYDSAPALDDGEPLGLGMSLDEAIAANRPKKTSQPPRKKASGGGGDDDASARVYVGNMKYETTWQQLKDHFATCANVVHARVLEGRTGHSIGCGVVEFGSPQDAQNAIATMHDGELDGRKLLVREDREEEKPQQQPAKKKKRERNDDVHTVGKKLYVGNLNYQTTWQQLKDHFKDCGRVARADVNRGYGTVEFETAQDASNAISRKANTELDGRNIVVREDQAKPAQARKRMKSNEGGTVRVGKRVYVGNLKFSTSWQTLKDHFKPVGSVVHAKLISRGCGIVEFEAPEDARRAILDLNDSQLEGRPLQVREDREDRDLQ